MSEDAEVESLNRLEAACLGKRCQCPPGSCAFGDATLEWLEAEHDDEDDHL